MILVSVIALVLAALAFLQASSSVLTRKQPALATQLFPLNGLAWEQMASREFMSGVTEEADIVPSAQSAADTARRAFALDPLAPKAFAVLAFAEGAGETRQEVLGAALEINRRDLLLQGLVLEGEVARKDYEGTLATLSSILRVHPEQKTNFFPVLMQALADDAALPALAGILDRSEEWHDDFLGSAARNPAVTANLATLRLSRGAVDPDIDRRLIEGLLAAGDVGKARNIYVAASNTAETNARTPSPIDWRKDFPPFDWKLADEAGFRAQLAKNQTDLELFVRGGQGGPIAERLIAVPLSGFTVTVEHQLGPPEQVKDVRLQVRCFGDEEPFYDEPFRIRRHSFRISNVPARCDFVTLTIHARAWTGRSAIRGTLSRLAIGPN
ncbi:hypothetical protein GRI35_01550 [Altererythrobacter aestiaquae]|uniref:Uncharacterized protein n=1 Tax=Pontixanthobacter aestiaquae TaxID=1509367 RepID=A0A844Z4N2_9SPHN|nr:hypothetical protein [Pontixanthobacter aestiaquae]